MIRDEIEKIINKAVNKISLKYNGRRKEGKFSVETTKDFNYGDYSTNVALVLANQLGKNPVEVANEIVDTINHSHILENVRIEKVGVAGPGFINFYLTNGFFIDELKKVGKDFGKNNSLKNKKVIVEYTDPNILKEFHIGHLMSNSIGESISRVLEFQGAKTKRFCYQSDVGIGIAKAVFGKLKNPDLPWQQAYVAGNNAFESNEDAKKEITELNKKIFDRSDKKINKVYDEGKKWSLEYFNEIYKRLGTRFDNFILESQVAGFGKEVVEKNIGKVFEKGDNGAIVFKGENHGLHTRVFINSQGLPTYEAKELGLAKIKYDKFKYDASVIITGNEINAYFKVLLSAMKQIFPELAEKTKHIGHGMMRLPEGKMSSRTGNVITAEFLIEKVQNMVLQKIAERNFSDQEKREVSEQVAIGALKYSILKQSIGSDIIYDFEKSISFEGDSGPYLQYAYVRAKSVLEKAKTERINPNLRMHPNTTNALVKMIARFPEVVERAGTEYQLHIIATYLIELAREFNNYYANNQIVDKSDDLSSYKVVLTRAFSVAMKNGLWLLGISAPDKM